MDILDNNLPFPAFLGLKRDLKVRMLIARLTFYILPL